MRTSTGAERSSADGQYGEAAYWMEQAAALGREVLGERHGITMQALDETDHTLRYGT